MGNECSIQNVEINRDEQSDLQHNYVSMDERLFHMVRVTNKKVRRSTYEVHQRDLLEKFT